MSATIRRQEKVAFKLVVSTHLKSVSQNENLNHVEMNIKQIPETTI